jgi:hypothetical protein
MSVAIEQPPEVIDGEARVPQDVPQRPGADITTRVNRNGRSPAVRMAHDVVAAIDPADDESRLLRRVHHLAAPHRGNWWHQATSRTVIVSSSGTPEFREPAVKRLAEVSDSLFWGWEYLHAAAGRLGGCAVPRRRRRYCPIRSTILPWMCRPATRANASRA